MELVSKAIGFILKNTSAITDEVASEFMFFGQVPQRTNPDSYVRFFISDVDPTASKVGQALIDYYFIDIDIFSIDPSVCSAAAKAIRDNLDRYPAGAVSGVNLNEVIFLRGNQQPDNPDDLDHTVFTLEFEVRVERSRATPVALFAGDYTTTEKSIGVNWINGNEIKVRMWQFDSPSSPLVFTGIIQASLILKGQIVGDDKSTNGDIPITADMNGISWNGSAYELAYTVGTQDPIYVTLLYVDE